MNLQPVKSKMLAAFGYDPDKSELHVQFPTGKTYVYQGVTPEQHAEFAGAESFGKHFGQNIRGKFPHRILEGK